jgi:hypothetical protein
MICIGPRYVSRDKDGLRPFQRQALEAIRNSDARLIFACPEPFDKTPDRRSRSVEAPVGAVKLGVMKCCKR